mgnify:CR=1 FL=1
MAVLANADRQRIFEEFMGEISADQEVCPVVKADLRAAFNAADDFAVSVASTYNAALPQPFRGAASASLKARVFQKVLRERWIKGV